MRLLNTETLKLHEFIGDVPHYAILSHRWELEEVSFQDLQSGKGPQMAGYQKILGCCEQAKKDGWNYAWIDSCCIDKTSSSELSEAINSMFQWYRNSQVCYAYLSDVTVRYREDLFIDQFRVSKWFKRGWTLQELLAPEDVVFYNKSWVDIGTKYVMEGLISSIVGVKDLNRFGEASIAQKMSWAANRETTRKEDMAYCLMGLFGINMPLLYGEGDKAFIRLQLEIMKVSDDETLFAWKEHRRLVPSWIFANSPSLFKHSGDVERFDFFKRMPYSVDNKGLGMHILTEVAMLRFGKVPKGEPFTNILNCRREGKTSPLAIKLLTEGDEDHCQRTRCDELLEYDVSRTPNWKSEFQIAIVHIKQQDAMISRSRNPNLVLVTLHDVFRRSFDFVKGVMLATPDRILAPVDNRAIGYLDLAIDHIGMTLQAGEVAALVFWQNEDLPNGQHARKIIILVLNKFGGRLGVMVCTSDNWPEFRKK